MKEILKIVLWVTIFLAGWYFTSGASKGSVTEWGLLLGFGLFIINDNLERNRKEIALRLASLEAKIDAMSGVSRQSWNDM